MACLTHDIGQHAGSNRTAKVRNQVVQILSICDQRQSRHTSHTHRIEGNVEQTDQRTADACTDGTGDEAEAGGQTDTVDDRLTDAQEGGRNRATAGLTDFFVLAQLLGISIVLLLNSGQLFVFRLYLR